MRFKVDPKKILEFRKRFLKNPVDQFFGFFSHDVGIDLGTANTLVWVKGKGIVIREPSVVARHKKTKEIIAIGSSAKKMQGKTPMMIESVRPLKDGVIADFDATCAMLTRYINIVHQSSTILPKIPKPKVVIGIPSGVTEVEKRAVADASITAGAREVHLIEETIAGAIGAGFSIEGPQGVFIVDIGGGTTEVAVISLGGVVVGRSIRTAGDEMNEAIISYLRLKYSLLLGETSAEELKIAIGNCKPFAKEKFYVVRGRDLETGLPRSIKVSASEVREALSPVVHEIVRNVVQTIEETPPELVSDIMERGIWLTGGGALLSGIDEVISEETKMPVFIVKDPLTCVVRGCGKILEDTSILQKIKKVKA